MSLVPVVSEEVIKKEDLPAGVSDASDLASKSEIPTTASDVGAKPDSYSAVQSVNGDSGPHIELSDGIEWGYTRITSTKTKEFDEPRVPYSYHVYSGDDSNFGGASIDTTVYFDDGNTFEAGVASHNGGWRDTDLASLAKNGVSNGGRVEKIEVEMGGDNQALLVWYK